MKESVHVGRLVFVNVMHYEAMNLHKPEATMDGTMIEQRVRKLYTFV